MPFIPDADGTITTYQGDTGDLIINGIPVDQNYRVYFAIQDAKRNFKGSEIMVNSLNQSSVVIHIPAEVTDELSVPLNKSYETYYYGIKLVTPGTFDENTL